MAIEPRADSAISAGPSVRGNYLLRRLLGFRLLLAIIFIVIFNLTIAVRPPTAPPPPIWNLGSQLWLHSSWAPVTYVGQARYIYHLYGPFQVIAPIGGYRPSDSFFQQTEFAELVIRYPSRSESLYSKSLDSERGGADLLAEGADVVCKPAQLSLGSFERRCQLRIIARPHGQVAPGSLQLYAVTLGETEIVLVDMALYDTEVFLEFSR